MTTNWIGSNWAAYRINIPLVQIFDAAIAWIERNQQRRALARLDDRLLADIGVSRCDAEREINNSSPRK